MSLAGSLRGCVSELILNAKGKWGQHGERVVGRRQGSDLIWTLGCHRSRSEQVLQSLQHYPAFGPAPGTHTKWACIIQGHHMLCAARQSVGNVGPSFPKRPLLRIINKQDGRLYSHFTAGEICSHNRKSCTCCRKILF